MKKKVLVFTYLQRHLKKMVPILKALNQKENIELTLLLMTSEERQIAAQNGIEYEMLDIYTENPRHFDFDLGWGLQPLIAAIDTIHPDLFLAIEVNYILRNAVRHCKKEGIQTVVVQHGTPNKYSLHAFLPFEGDYFLAWGKHSVDYLCENGLDPDKVILTGGVSFDRTASMCADREGIAQVLGISPLKKWLVFTTQGTGPGGMPTPDEVNIGLTYTARLIKKYPEYELIYQVHPSQDIDAVAQIVHSVNESCFVGKYSDTEALIKTSDGVITFFSTTAIDAILLKKPLYLINLSDDKDFFPFYKMGAAVASFDKENIEEDFDRFIAGSGIEAGALEKSAQIVNFKNDGMALDRVLETIDNILLHK